MKTKSPDDVQAFVDYCQRYARSRRAPLDSVEGFPSYAWEKLYVLKWKCSLQNVWRNYCRDRLGFKGGHKEKFMWSLQAGKRVQGHWENRFEDGKGSFLEEAVKAPEFFQMLDVRSLSKRDRMLLCLIQCDFELSEIVEELFPKMSAQQFRLKLQERLRLNQQVEELLGEKPMEEKWACRRFDSDLAKRKKKAQAFS